MFDWIIGGVVKCVNSISTWEVQTVRLIAQTAKKLRNSRSGALIIVGYIAGVSYQRRVFEDCSRSVYAYSSKLERAEKHYRRIKEYATKTGVVRMLRLTEKQNDNITMITGEPDYQEQTVGTNCHIMI